jgi:hypothetical protein
MQWLKNKSPRAQVQSAILENIFFHLVSRHKMLPEEIHKKLDERKARAASRGFTYEYQNAREQVDNTICHKQLAPATLRNYENTVLNWALLVIPIPVWDH